MAWLAAGFLSVGFLTHLILDEIYSVDVMDTRIKASFGTALKLVDTKHWGHSAAMAAATVLAFMVTPPTKVFVENITSRALWIGAASPPAAAAEQVVPSGMAWVLENPPAVKANTVPHGRQSDLRPARSCRGLSKPPKGK